MTRDTAPAGRRNIRLVLAYDGTPYLGWQVQPQGPTVQSTLQEGVQRITGERVCVKGSGRTDAGVHALGQVANFRTASNLSPGTIARALNGILPRTIAVLQAEEVPDDFDAQYSAVGKLYRYRVFNSRTRSPFELTRSWQVTSRLNLESMIASSSIISGKKDFSTFRAAGCTASNPVRNVTRCEIVASGEIISFEIEADGFLRHMVRNLVGTLVEVGQGRFSTDGFAALLEARDRTRAGIAAPPQGLYLVRVDYPRQAFARPETDTSFFARRRCATVATVKDPQKDLTNDR